jgi:hypothetical protein
MTLLGGLPALADGHDPDLAQLRERLAFLARCVALRKLRAHVPRFVALGLLIAR